MRPTMTSHTRNGAFLLLRPNPIKGNYPRVGSPLLPPVAAASSPIQSGSTHHPAAKQNAIRPSGISFRGRQRAEGGANGREQAAYGAHRKKKTVERMPNRASSAITTRERTRAERASVLRRRQRQHRLRARDGRGRIDRQADEHWN